MKRLLLVLGIVLFVVGGLMAPAFAEEEGVVTVTVEPPWVSITVIPDSVGYGMVEIPSTDNTLVEPAPDKTIVVINNGNCWASFDIRGADTTNWTLGTSPDVDTYVHHFGYPGPPAWDTLSTDSKDLDGASYEPGCSVGIKLKMDTPSSTDYYEQQTTTVTVLATKEAKGISADLVITPDTTAVTLTVTVTDENDAPLTGLALSAFSTLLRPEGGNFQGASPQPTFTETDSTGIYEGALDISGLASGTYDVKVTVTDTSNRKACGDDSFTK